MLLSHPTSFPFVLSDPTLENHPRKVPRTCQSRRANSKKARLLLPVRKRVLVISCVHDFPKMSLSRDVRIVVVLVVRRAVCTEVRSFSILPANLLPVSIPKSRCLLTVLECKPVVRPLAPLCFLATVL